MVAKPIHIQNSFSKGFVEGKGRNKTPTYYASIAKNCRVDNASITPRRGRDLKNNFTAATNVKAMTFNKFLYVVRDGTLQKIDQNTGNVLDILPLLGGDVPTNLISYGDYVIVLDGLNYPRVLDVTGAVMATSFVDTNATNFPNDVKLSNPKPIIGTTFSGFTFLTGTAEKTDNVLFISKAIFAQQPQNAYDWNDTTPPPGSANPTQGEQITFSSPVLGMKGTLNRLYIFTERTIETIDKNSITELAGSTSLFSRPLGDGDQVISQNAIVPVGDKIFYITQGQKVKTIGWIQGLQDPQIGEISDRPLLSIQEFLKDLDPDQSEGRGYYNKGDSTVRRYLKTLGATNNDISLVYDLENDTFYIDTNKEYNAGTRTIGENYFVGSSILGQGAIYQEDVGLNDDDVTGTEQPIEFQYKTVDISMGDPVLKKQFRGFEFAGQMNLNTSLDLVIQTDGEVVRDDIVDTTYISEPTTDPLDLYHFDAVSTRGIRSRGKRINIDITANELDQEFALDYLGLFANAVTRYDRGDKF